MEAIKVLSTLWNFRLCKRHDISSRLSNISELFDVNKSVLMDDLSYLKNYKGNKNDHYRKMFNIKEIIQDEHGNDIIILTNGMSNNVVCFESNI